MSAQERWWFGFSRLEGFQFSDASQARVVVDSEKGHTVI